MSFLLSPFRTLRDARRILRLPDAKPDNWALFKCWLATNSTRDERGPVGARLGPLTIHAHHGEELSYLFKEVFLRREYHVDLRRPDPVILDCGANIGFATLFFKLHYPAARITAFEPNPSCFEHLRRHIEENQLRDVTPVQAACGKSEGELSFFVSPGYSRVSSIHSGRSADSQEIKVRVVRLSSHVQGEVDLLKLDVEGSEWDVLADLVESGAIARIRRMIIEYHHRIGGAKAELGRFLQILEDAGFTYDIIADLQDAKPFNGLFQDVMVYASRAEVK